MLFELITIISFTVESFTITYVCMDGMELLYSNNTMYNYRGNKTQMVNIESNRRLCKLQLKKTKVITNRKCETLNTNDSFE